MDLVEQTSSSFSMKRHVDLARQAKLMILSGLISPTEIASKLIEQFEVSRYGPQFKIGELLQIITDDEFIEELTSLQDDVVDKVLDLLMAAQRGDR